MKAFLDDFLKNVAYPAVAGNVAWSFATLAIERGLNVDTAPRLGALLVLTIYFAAEWYRSKDIPTSETGVWADLLFVICMVWFALATQANKGLPGVALVLILIGVGLGHLRGVWPPAGKGKGNVPHGLVSLLAGVILGIAWIARGSWNAWFALVALAVVVVVWAFVRRGVKT